MSLRLMFFKSIRVVKLILSLEQSESNKKGSILKNGKSGEKITESLGIKWDEEVIAEHDKTRGQTTKIDEPKTPYHERSDDEDAGDEDDEAPESIEIKKHLSQAEENCKLNAELNKKSLDLLKNKLENVGDKLKDEEEDLSEEEQKKKEEFRKKMKAHYKGEANAALLLKKKY